MTLLELVTHLRRNILHDTGGTGVDWTSYSEDDYDSIQLRWKNEELVANINEAIKAAYRSINPISDIYELKVKANINSYALKSYVKKILEVRRADGNLLDEISFLELPRSDSLTATGTLSKYITDEISNEIRVFPTPIAAETLRLVVYRLPKVELDWVDNDVSPELREDYQIPMLNYAAYLCYMKDEANTFDPNRAATYLSLFNRDFPATSVYSSERKSRTSNRSVKYGGL